MQTGRYCESLSSTLPALYPLSGGKVAKIGICRAYEPVGPIAIDAITTMANYDYGQLLSLGGFTSLFCSM
jgi:hypothetical protein